jgi:hypothetical protein
MRNTRTSACALLSALVPLLALFSGPGANAATLANRPASGIASEPTEFDIGVSPFLDNSVKDEVFRSVVRLLVQELPLNSQVNIYDAFYLRSITGVGLPESRAFTSPKTRANQFAPAIRELKQFLATEHSRPTNSVLHFKDAVRLPQFCEFLADHPPSGGATRMVLLFGSPLYEDAKEPAFSMLDGYFPSDGHLRAPREK